MGSSRTLAGWASAGSSLSAGNRNISTITGRRSPSCGTATWCFHASARARIWPLPVLPLKRRRKGGIRTAFALYPGTCRHLPAAEVTRRIERGDPHTWRLDSTAACRDFRDGLTYRRLDADGCVHLQAADPGRWGDAIVVRREIPTSYHLSVVVDDALQHVTHVVRGQDLEAATDLHILLQRLLGLPSPTYHHHGLLLDDQGEKLAKSRFSQTLRDLREAGMSAGEIRKRLGFP